MIIRGMTEAVFAYAVALNQSGRMKNIIHCYGNTAFIINFDNTVLLRFELPETESEFGAPVSFFANDYDSANFTMTPDGKVVFSQPGEAGGFMREKICTVPGQSFADVERIYKDHVKVADKYHINKVVFSKSILAQLNEELSHLEFLGDPQSGTTILQRDIYAGTLIKLTRQVDGFGLGLISNDQIQKAFGPLGMRTPDFFALFSFRDALAVRFPKSESDRGFFMVEGEGMTGVVAACLYDDLGRVDSTISESEHQKSSETSKTDAPQPDLQGGGVEATDGVKSVTRVRKPKQTEAPKDEPAKSKPKRTRGAAKKEQQPQTEPAKQSGFGLF